jgi:hypothetical protein
VFIDDAFDGADQLSAEQIVDGRDPRPLAGISGSVVDSGIASYS